MGFGYILIGMIFLSNPNINVFDILPDFVGFLFIYRGLYTMSFATVKLAEVREGTVWKLALITALRAASFFLLPYTSDTFTLVLVFSFGVLETIYLVPFVSGLFDGFYSLGTRFGAESVFDTRIRTPERGKMAGQSIQIEGAERLKIFTVLFFLLKVAAPVLPELTTLERQNEFTSDSRLYTNLIAFRPMFYVLCTAIVLVFGIIWLVCMIRYLGRIRRDTPLLDAISQHYKEHVASRPQMLVALRMKKIHLLLLLTAIASFTLSLDGVTVVPKIVSAALACAVFVMLLREDRLCLAGIAFSAATGIYSVVNQLLQIPYYREYSAMDARYFAGAAAEYSRIQVLGVLEYILIGATVILLLVVCVRANSHHTDFIRLGNSSAQYSRDARRMEIVGTVRGSALWCGLFALLYCGFGIASYYLMMYYLFANYLTTVASLIFVIAMYRYTATAHEQIYDRLERDY